MDADSYERIVENLRRQVTQLDQEISKEADSGKIPELEQQRRFWKEELDRAEANLMALRQRRR